MKIQIIYNIMLYHKKIKHMIINQCKPTVQTSSYTFIYNLNSLGIDRILYFYILLYS